MRGAGLARRITIQSFDWRTLIAARRLAPEIETVCLTYEKTLQDQLDGGNRRPSPWLAGLDPAAHGGSVPRLAAAAGCGTWSPYFRELRPGGGGRGARAGPQGRAVDGQRREDLARLIDMKVDGLITDYPDRAREVMAAKGIALP